MSKSVYDIIECIQPDKDTGGHTRDHRVAVDLLLNAKSEVREDFLKNHLPSYPSLLNEAPSELLIQTLEVLGAKEFSKILISLPVDEIVDVLEVFDQKSIKEIIPFFPITLQKVIKEILDYPEESAGRLIHKDFIVIPKDWTVEQVIQFIRLQKAVPKYSNQIFIIDEEKRPIGSISVDNILCAKSRTPVASIMQSNIATVDTEKDQEDVANLFREYSLQIVAVVDEEGKIVGVISIDDVVDIISEEAEEDILHAGKVSESDINASVFNTVLHRIKWLIVTFFSINLSSYVIGFFESTLKENVELAILMPIMAAMGGNAGIQASTVAVRGIITKRITYNSFARLFCKEMLVGMCNGAVMAVLMLVIINLRFGNASLEWTFALATLVVFILATSVGAAIPFLIERFKGDPALSSSIITSSFTDILAFFVLLSIAHHLL